MVKWDHYAIEPRFTSEERYVAVHLLKRALAQLATTAMLSAAVKRCLTTQAEIDVEPKLQDLMRARLGGRPSLRIWLLDKGYPAQGNDAKTYVKVQDAQRRWARSLIDELSVGMTAPVPRKRLVRQAKDINWDRWWE